MAITLDPAAALVVIDMQKGILAMPPAEAVTPLVESTNRLADAFHSAGLPVVWVHATGLPAGRTAHPIAEEDPLPADFTQLHDDLHVAAEDHRVAKQRTWSAFPRTDLAEHLRALGTTTVVLCGIATGAGVESTARSAYDEGFHVVTAADATLDGNPQRYALSLAHSLTAVGLVGTVEEIIAALLAR